MVDSPKMDCSALVTRGEVQQSGGLLGGGGRERGLGQGQGQGQGWSLSEDEVLQSRAEVLQYQPPGQQTGSLPQPPLG